LLAHAPAWLIHLTAAAVCQAAIAWVTKSNFVVQGRLPIGSAVVIAANAIGLILVVLAMLDHTRDTIVPLPLYGLCLALLIWTVRATRDKGLTVAFTNDTPKRIVRDGPYRWVRHPFYLSYLLFWLANALATSAWEPWLVFAFMVGLYTAAAKMEERKFARSALRHDYARYKREIGMFLPGTALAGLRLSSRRDD
jgi:protein-S-isoprenylcysteine O-methyltransferase Ste14